MSNYTKTIDFTAKDNLAPGTPAKAGKGADIDSELSAIQAAIVTKEDSVNKGASSGYAALDANSKLVNDLDRYQYVVALTNQTINNSITLIDDTSLTLPVVAGKIYAIEAYLFFQNTVSATPGVTYGLVGPALNYATGVVDYSSGSGTAISSTTALATSLVIPVAITVITTTSLRGVISASASGNLRLQWAQTVAHASNTIRSAGSWYRLQRLN